MVSFADGLLQLGYGVDFLVAQNEGPLKGTLPAEVRLINLAKRKVASALPGLVRYLRRERPAALFSTIVNANIAALCAHALSGSHCPIVIRESNVVRPKGPLTLARRFSGHLAPLVYRLADSIISVSEDVATELSTISPRLKERISVLPNPVVSKTILSLADAEPDHPWFRNDAPQPDPIIVGAGRLHPQKDFGSLIAAFAEVTKRRPSKLLILGEGDERPALEAQVAALQLSDRVSLPGHMTNPFPYLKRANVFVLSSRYEGMPNVLLQAMAFGTPVVATDGPTGAAEILRGTSFGKLVKASDIGSLADAITESLDAPRCPAAAAFVTERYSVERATREYLHAAGLHAGGLPA